MLRYIAGVKWRDRVTNEEVLKVCGLVDLGKRLQQRRLQWFGHVKRAEETLIAKVEAMKMEGRRPVGRPRKSWRKCVLEDIHALGINESLVQDRLSWRRAINPSNPS